MRDVWIEQLTEMKRSTLLVVDISCDLKVVSKLIIMQPEKENLVEARNSCESESFLGYHLQSITAPPKIPVLPLHNMVSSTSSSLSSSKSQGWTLGGHYDPEPDRDGNTYSICLLVWFS